MCDFRLFYNLKKNSGSRFYSDDENDEIVKKYFSSILKMDSFFEKFAYKSASKLEKTTTSNTRKIQYTLYHSAASQKFQSDPRIT